MITSTLKGVQVIGLAGLIFVFGGHTGVQASGLVLKKTSLLGTPLLSPIKPGVTHLGIGQFKRDSMSNNLSFRGVAVRSVHENLSALTAQAQSQMQIERRKIWVEPAMPVKGTLQVPVQGRLSLMYAPVGLSKGTGGSDSQGLYVLRNTSPNTSWFMGIESGEYSLGNGGRDEAKSAHLGVIYTLD